MTHRHCITRRLFVRAEALESGHLRQNSDYNTGTSDVLCRTAGSNADVFRHVTESPHGEIHRVPQSIRDNADMLALVPFILFHRLALFQLIHIFLIAVEGFFIISHQKFIMIQFPMVSSDLIEGSANEDRPYGIG